MSVDAWEIDRSIQDLYNICSLKRRADSKGEWELIKRFLIPAGLNRDDFGNWFIRVGTAPVLWSCHTDTVHFNKDDTDITQKLLITEHGFLSAQNSSCLGADCGAGIWLMLRMLERGVEGLYIFHREEEIGGNGSKFIATENASLLEGIKYAIAFDRRGTNSIITHQMYGRCCSDAFAESLATELGMDHKPDSSGMFTDTANYTKLIPECTNISVGFYEEHTFKEWLDTQYLKELLEKVARINFDNLVVKRNTSDQDGYDWSNWEDFYERYQPDRETYEENSPTDLIARHPQMVVKILEEWGVLEDVVREIEIALSL